MRDDLALPEGTLFRALQAEAMIRNLSFSNESEPEGIVARNAYNRHIRLKNMAPGKDRERCRVTFLGHSSALIAMNGLNILADPHLSRHILFLI